jgi:hypothetical protein
METSLKVLGPEHPSLAWTLKLQGRDEEAYGLISTCIELSRMKLGPNHPYTIARSWTLALWKLGLEARI